MNTLYPYKLVKKQSTRVIRAAQQLACARAHPPRSDPATSSSLARCRTEKRRGDLLHSASRSDTPRAKHETHIIIENYAYTIIYIIYMAII